MKLVEPGWCSCSLFRLSPDIDNSSRLHTYRFFTQTTDNIWHKTCDWFRLGYSKFTDFHACVLISNRTGRRGDPGAIETFCIDQKSGREVRHYLSNITELCTAAAAAASSAAPDGNGASACGPSPPAVIIVDNLHHVTSLADTFSAFLAEENDDQQGQSR